MADPSILHESMSLQDPLAKKMQFLQTENNTLRQERGDFESNIRQYAHTISQLEDQLINLQQTNAELTETNRSYVLKIRRLEIDLERSNNQYRSLYNHAHAGQKRSHRDLILKEIQLTNELNEIQFNGYSNIILGLKENLTRKNQELMNLNQQNTQLKEQILQISYQYQEKITELKEEVVKLRVQNQQVPVNKLQKPEESQLERMMSARVDCLREQMEILEKENSRISKQLQNCKQELHHFKSEAQWLKIEIETVKSEKEVSMDFSEIQAILAENITLKKSLQQETFKLATILRNNPGLLCQTSEIDLAADFKDISTKYEKTLEEVQTKDKQIVRLKNEKSEADRNRLTKEEQYLRLKASTTKIIDKLKNIIKNYVPCFNLYGYADFGFNEEECKLVEGNAADIYKEFDRISNELVQKTAEINKLSSQIKGLETRLRQEERKLVQERKRSNGLDQDKQKLQLAVESLTERWEALDQQKAYQRMKGQQESPRFEGQGLYPSIGSQRKHYFPDLNRQQSLTKLDSICELALSLQKDRQQMLACIRQKDAIIAEANAQLKVLRSECKPKVYQFQSNSLSAYASQSINQSIMSSSNSQSLLQKQTEQYNKLKENISSMAVLYQNEINLLEEEHNNKYSEINIKYSKILRENQELRENIKKLEKLNEQSMEKHSEVVSKRAESVQDDAVGLELDENVPRDDKNIISEATIQIINDLLKKYEKEFSRFSSLYESQLAKARQLKRINFEELDRQGTEQQLYDKVQRIEQIIQEREQTIRILQNEARQKQELFRVEKERFEQNEVLSEQRMAQLESRLNTITSELEIIQTKGIGGINLAEGTTSKSISFILTALSAKNQEICCLKQSLQQKECQITKLSEQINALKAKMQNEMSQLQLQEFRQFKKLVQDGELSYVLQKAADLLSVRQGGEQ